MARKGAETCSFTTWHRLRPAAAALLAALALLAGGCAKDTPKSVYQGDEAAAVLDWSRWQSAEVLAIDGRPSLPDRRKIKLEPGRHEIRYGGWFPVSILYGTDGAGGERSAAFTLEAGRVYLVHHARVSKTRSFKDFFWIEDAATRKLIHGDPPPLQGYAVDRRLRVDYDRSTDAALQQLLIAANCGDPEARYRLAASYLTGGRLPVERDLVHAYAWLGLAAEAGLGEAAVVRRRVRLDMSAAEIATAEDLLASAAEASCD